MLNNIIYIYIYHYILYNIDYVLLICILEACSEQKQNIVICKQFQQYKWVQLN